MPDVVALQLSIGDSDLPVLVTDEAFSARLAAAGLDPVTTLRASVAEVAAQRDGRFGAPVVHRLEATGGWLATVVLPLDTQIAGQRLSFSARIDLAELAKLVQGHPFVQRGEITLIDDSGRTVLEAEPRQLADRDIVASAMSLLGSSARADALEPYVRPDGAPMLGAFAFPRAFPWAVVTELDERDAYAVVQQMTANTALIGALGLGAAVLAAFVFAQRLTRPILRIGEAARLVGQGDFTTRVVGVRRRDEIGDLAGRMNAMIGELSERVELMKFVSRGTVTAIQAAGATPMDRVGQRRRVAVLFSDIRGYTAFSESVAPEIVVEALNLYLEAQTAIVEAHGGDVDKFVGDEVVALFQGEGIEARAVACALEIQRAMPGLLEAHPEWNLHVGIGVSAGEVVLGAIGARDRMDFTVLGDTVNLASRLCDAAPPDAVLVSDAVQIALAVDPALTFRSQTPLALKGKRQPVPVFTALATPGAEAARARHAQADLAGAASPAPALKHG
jgi:adenylate cyclase